MRSIPRRRLVALAAGACLSSALLLLAGTVPSADAAGVYHGLLGLTSSSSSPSQSSNWFGYSQGVLDTGSPSMSIGGTWTVPTVSAHTAGQAGDSATWIGIGGGCLTDAECAAGDETLIQAGTEQDVNADGTTSYSAWYEIIPAPSTTVTLPVHPGDSITVTITQSVPGLWSIVIKDNTTGQTSTTSTPYSSDYSTAEWITETPLVIGSSGAGEASLPTLSTVGFTGATVNGSPAGLQAAQEIQLVDSNGNVIGAPSAPGSGGASFNDCSWASTCAAP